jgi:hypothetical protein
VVEEAAVLVVVDDEHGLRPDLGVGDQNGQDLLDKVRRVVFVLVSS